MTMPTGKAQQHPPSQPIGGGIFPDLANETLMSVTMARDYIIADIKEMRDEAMAAAWRKAQQRSRPRKVPQS
jgi:hypothetical protein